jgi:two-component system sensor histidine kinase/response regulator
LLGILNDILDFSKVEAGKMELDPQPFLLDSLLRNLSVIVSANVSHKNVELLFEVDSKLPAAFLGDSLRLQQILINLTGNAIKFTAQGEVVVSITLESLRSQQASVRIAVRDSGIGIDPKNHRHIFSGFSQAEVFTTRHYGGTGLGLSICRRLVELMGGGVCS